jgi:hypothetical protein
MRHGKPQIWPGRQVGFGGPFVTFTVLGKPGGGGLGGGGGGGHGPFEGGVGNGPGLYVQMIGGPLLLVWVCVIVAGGGIMLLVSQMIPPAKVDDVVAPPETDVGSQTTFDR